MVYSCAAMRPFSLHARIQIGSILCFQLTSRNNTATSTILFFPDKMLLVLSACYVQTALAASECGFNPGGAKVPRADGTTYPYFGMVCKGGSDCGVSN